MRQRRTPFNLKNSQETGTENPMTKPPNKNQTFLSALTSRETTGCPELFSSPAGITNTENFYISAKLKADMLIILSLTHSYRRLFNCLMFYDQAN